MKILGLIPARAGSKGIPGKNGKRLAGKPLIQYAIDAGLSAGVLDRVVVSTDGAELAEMALQLGAEVPFLRPAELAADHSPTIDTVIHALHFFQGRGEDYDAVCLLQPTSPLRTASDIQEAVQKFEQLDSDCLLTVVPVPHQYNPHWTFKVDDKNQHLYLATGETEIIPRRQDLPPAYIRNGAIYLTKSSIVLEQQSLYGASIGYHLMPLARSVNIDNPQDWERATKLLENET